MLLVFLGNAKECARRCLQLVGKVGPTMGAISSSIGSMPSCVLHVLDGKAAGVGTVS